MLTFYQQAFEKLKLSPAQSWPESTYFRAPYKPFMLLAVSDLIATGTITHNFIEYSDLLLETFDRYWQMLFDSTKLANPIQPFFYLRSEGFWHLQAQPGMEQRLAATTDIKTIGQLKQLVVGAKLDQALFDLLQQPFAREQLRQSLIQPYFMRELQPALATIGQMNTAIFSYADLLVEHSQRTFREIPAIDTPYLVEVRSSAFRRVVVPNYDYCCAICGIRIITPEGRSAVEAAHIIPWSKSYNDDPRNGVSLCGLHHWLFDQGLLTITPNYQIQISRLVAEQPAANQAVLMFAQQPIQLPQQKQLYPNQIALDWHNQHVYRR
ncbi:HNH endonuclease [Herpetosiphon llansteffanensis]|uniref:HNH endonuclease n=1 Tax=Herpetosiphon llansteffanensis TaxID=2094568 RepID=UPI000D7CC967|nr:HNH endonuclease [Herpetosiphon llansteffanensis]